MTVYKKYVCDKSRWLVTFGDVDFINYGGQLLVLGVLFDAPYLEVIVQPNEAECGDWTPEARWEIYRVEPEQFKIVEADSRVYLVPLRYEADWPNPLSSYDAWFHDSLQSVANLQDTTVEALRDAFCSEDPAERAFGYVALASHHGWFEFDQYPLSLTQHEVHKRYGMESDCACQLCAK